MENYWYNSGISSTSSLCCCLCFPRLFSSSLAVSVSAEALQALTSHISVSAVYLFSLLRFCFYPVRKCTFTHNSPLCRRRANIIDNASVSHDMTTMHVTILESYFHFYPISCLSLFCSVLIFSFLCFAFYPLF